MFQYESVDRPTRMVTTSTQKVCDLMWSRAILEIVVSYHPHSNYKPYYYYYMTSIKNANIWIKTCLTNNFMKCTRRFVFELLNHFSDYLANTYNKMHKWVEAIKFLALRKMIFVFNISNIRLSLVSVLWWSLIVTVLSMSLCEIYKIVNRTIIWSDAVLKLSLHVRLLKLGILYAAYTIYI